MSRTPRTRREQVAKRSRSELVSAIVVQLRAASTRSVLLHAAIAERLGLNPSDHKCADLLMSQAEATTPGRLAELTGLSTGAITGVIDRLERAGFVERTHDVADRRRILLRVLHGRAPDMQKLFAPLIAATGRMCDRFSPEELEIVLRFMRATDDVVEDVMVQLRESAPTAQRRRVASEQARLQLSPPAPVNVGASPPSTSRKPAANQPRQPRSPR